MRTVKIWNDTPSDRQLEEIAAWLRDGEVMIWPTDTLYGIACSALEPKAIEQVCRIKGINPEKTNLSIVCPDIAFASQYARIDDKVYRLMRDLTPGPFTFLCRAASSLPRAFKGRKTVGVRIPANETARAIATALEAPVLTATIEYSDEDYARNPELIAEAYEGCVSFMVEGEEGGLEPSTVIDCTGSEPEIVRQGAGEVSL